LTGFDIQPDFGSKAASGRIWGTVKVTFCSPNSIAVPQPHRVILIRRWRIELLIRFLV
jgi:hypothetical protein